jgi:Zn-dependent M28 family amino/carboxypeptidase
MNHLSMHLVATALLLALSACSDEDVVPLQTPPATVAATAAATATLSADEQRIAADVRYLADDKLEGRETGTRGYDLAAEYAAKRFREIGLQPAGDEGDYFQTVPLLKATRLAEGATLIVKRNGREIALQFREQFLPALNFNAAEHAVEAPAIFVGQGVHAPELKHDDLAGLDLRGKIAVVFPGAPKRFDNDRRAFYSASREKLRTLAKRGAIGVVFVNTPEDEASSPWSRNADNWQRSGMRLRGADGKGMNTFPELLASANVSAAAADLIFADGPQPAATLFQAAQAGTLKGFALPGTLALTARTKIEPAESRNVVAKLQGSDATLAAEHIVYTAHLDHIGIGAPVKDTQGVDDNIYNGALDNALGVAIMFEAARILHGSRPAPKRSLLFIALTAEEKGLLGAEWFAEHPTVPVRSLVANINMDMPVLLAPSKDVVPIGIEHSTLKSALDTAAKELGVGLSPDPFPEEVVFVRSDQYAFIRAGIPAVYLNGGTQSVDGVRDPKLALRKFLREHYHQPSDEATLPIAYGDAMRLAKLNARIGQLIGDASERPRWNPGDFFGEKFAVKHASH